MKFNTLEEFEAENKRLETKLEELEGIRCEYTSEIVCPHCGYELSDSWEYLADGEETELVGCPDCEKQFYAGRHIDITYVSSFAVEGECLVCGKTDVVLEEYRSSIEPREYSVCCVDCKPRKEKEAQRAYFDRDKEGKQ